MFEAQPGTEEPEADDESLGYYEDGVKRTLTDEQIAMFRHSEIQALLRDRRLKAENNDTSVEVKEDAGKSSLMLAEEVEDLAEENEEEEYARFLEEERRQMERDVATIKEKRSAEDASSVQGRKVTHRRTARELDVNLATNSSLNYGEESSSLANSGSQMQERTSELYERRKVDYADGDPDWRNTQEAEASRHVNGASGGGKKIWWPIIVS